MPNQTQGKNGGTARPLSSSRQTRQFLMGRHQSWNYALLRLKCLMTVDVSMGIGLENDGVVRAQLRDGAVMTLTCKLALERVRTLLSNEVLSEESRSYQLRHDLLSREFILSSPGQPIVRQKQFDTLLASAFQHLDFLLPLQAPLVSGENYRVQLKITLEHAEVPPWLEKALFFWSWEVTPPLSFSQDFIF